MGWGGKGRAGRGRIEQHTTNSSSTKTLPDVLWLTPTPRNPLSLLPPLRELKGNNVRRARFVDVQVSEGHETARHRTCGGAAQQTSRRIRVLQQSGRGSWRVSGRRVGGGHVAEAVGGAGAVSLAGVTLEHPPDRCRLGTQSRSPRCNRTQCCHQCLSRPPPAVG